MRAGPQSRQPWTRSPVLLRALASSLQNGDPGEPGELSCCAFQSELRGLAENFRWSFTDHSVIQQPLLYVLKVSPELWAAPAVPPLTQSRVPTSHGSPRQTGPRGRSGSTRTPFFSCQWGFPPCPCPGSSEALLCPARPLCRSLEALPPRPVDSVRTPRGTTQPLTTRGTWPSSTDAAGPSVSDSGGLPADLQLPAQHPGPASLPPLELQWC